MPHLTDRQVEEVHRLLAEKIPEEHAAAQGGHAGAQAVRAEHAAFQTVQGEYADAQTRQERNIAGRTARETLREDRTVPEPHGTDTLLSETQLSETQLSGMPLPDMPLSEALLVISSEYTRSLAEEMEERYAYEIPTQDALVNMHRELVYRTVSHLDSETREELLNYLKERGINAADMARLTDAQAEELHSLLTNVRNEVYRSVSRSAETEEKRNVPLSAETEEKRNVLLSAQTGKAPGRRVEENHEAEEGQEAEEDQEILRRIREFWVDGGWQEMREQVWKQEDMWLQQLEVERTFRNILGSVPASVETKLRDFQESRLLRRGILTYAQNQSPAVRGELMERLEERLGEQLPELVAKGENRTEHDLARVLAHAGTATLRRIVDIIREDFPGSGEEKLLQDIRQKTDGTGMLLTQHVTVMAQPGENIFDRPYSLVYQKKQVLEAVRSGNKAELQQIYSYMAVRRMLSGESTVSLSSRQEIRNLLFRRVQHLSLEDAADVSEHVVNRILEAREYRRAERDRQREGSGRRREDSGRPGADALEKLRLRPSGMLQNMAASVPLPEAMPGSVSMVHREQGKAEPAAEEIRQTVKQYVTEETTEARELRHRHEKTVRMVSGQMEEISKMKSQLMEQSMIVEELKSRKSEGLSKAEQNQLYRDMMTRLESSLRLERMRRGID